MNRFTLFLDEMGQIYCQNVIRSYRSKIINSRLQIQLRYVRGHALLQQYSECLLKVEMMPCDKRKCIITQRNCTYCKRYLGTLEIDILRDRFYIKTHPLKRVKPQNQIYLLALTTLIQRLQTLFDTDRRIYNVLAPKQLKDRSTTENDL